MAPSPIYQTRFPQARPLHVVAGPRSHQEHPTNTAKTQWGTPPTETENERVEVEYDLEKSEAEDAPSREDNLTCDTGTRRLLPASLSVSMTAGMISMAFLQMPLLFQAFHLGSVLKAISSGVLCILYASTLGCMAYCAFSDPGQIELHESDHGVFVQSNPLPKRAQKTWQYERPVRRYDHYCKWVTNSIGLLNHRPFIIMCVGIVMVALVGASVDTVLICLLIRTSHAHVRLFFILVHCAYSVLVLYFAGPILRIHVGLVSRNELAAEWKRNDFYVARESKRGNDVPVNDLGDSELEVLFDEFAYDQKKNPFDKGVGANCWAFWCTPRWLSHQLGEF